MKESCLILVAIFSVVLLAGCIEFLGTSPDTSTNESANATKNQSIIIVGGKNDTVVGNITTPSEIESLKQLKVQMAANYTYTPEKQFYIYFIYVGDNIQGDAIFIKKGDADILIDAGAAESGPKIVEFLNERGVDDLELLISTHADPEHYGGLAAVIGNFSIGKMVWSGRTYNDSNYQMILDKVSKEMRVPLHSGLRGDVFEINGINITLLNPVEKSFAAVDEDALVIKITDRNFCLLLTSDVLGGGLNDVLKKTNVTCEIIQIPRSGADHLSGGALVRNLITESKAKVAIISGAYKQDQSGLDFRLPLFEMLNQTNVLAYNNYQNGSLRIVSDGFEYDISYLKEH